MNKIFQEIHSDNSTGIDFRIDTNEGNNYQNHDKKSVGCSKSTNIIPSANGTLINVNGNSKSTYSFIIHNDSVNNIKINVNISKFISNSDCSTISCNSSKYKSNSSINPRYNNLMSLRSTNSENPESNDSCSNDNISKNSDIASNIDN